MGVRACQYGRRANIVESSSHASHEGRRADRRVPDPPEDALRVRPVRPRQRRPARRVYDVRDRIKFVSPRHEQVAAHMADAYFRVRHEAVATLTSCGPGSCNIVMPLAVALSDSSALLAITANVPTSQFNRSPFQEINKHFQADFPNIIRPVVKRSFQPTRVDMLPLALRQSMTTMMTGRSGPVNLDVPFNVFQEEDDVEMPRPAPA